MAIDFSKILEKKNDGLVSRDLSLCDDDFAKLLAQSLLSMRLGLKPSEKLGEISVRIQGNLCEFCIWELGEKYWEIYKKSNTRVPNASYPLGDISHSGIDIVAFEDDGKSIFFIEVKSTKLDGTNLIFGNSNSLQTDFQHLFEKKAVEERIWGSILPLISDLHHYQRYDIAENIKNSIGNKPELCKGVKLIGVLVCQKSKNDSSCDKNRANAFTKLHEWLTDQGWQPEQCEYRTVEVANFEKWLRSFVDQVTE